MKQIMAPKEIPEAFSAESLYLKSQKYAQKMNSEEVGSWEYALWSSLALELLARAALSNVSPALLAEHGKNWDHLFFSLGFAPQTPRYSPRSLPTNEVLIRLSEIFEQFTSDMKGFCVVHTGRRNSELHSGENAFEGVTSSSWQAKFFGACSGLLSTMDLTLTEYLGSTEAEVANKLIAAAADESAKAVKGDVAAHKKVWDAKPSSERDDLAASSKLWATRHEGHRVTCPACGTIAMVSGEAVSAPKQDLEDDLIKETQYYMPNQFECIACGLKASGLPKLTVIELAEQYKKTTYYDAAEFYAPEDEWMEYEEDNNER